MIITIETPTQKQYETLQAKFSNGLQCPCKQISIAYEKFVNITPEYNEICSSDFVSQKWIDYLFYENTSYYFQLDFRHSASSKFQILRTLCKQARATIDDTLEEFYSKQLITKQLVSLITFNAQTDAFVDMYKQITPSLFQNLLRLIRQVIIGNALFSAVEMHSTLQNNAHDSLDVSMDLIYYYEAAITGRFFSCRCTDETICQLPEGIYADIDRYDFAGSNWIDNQNVNANTAGINATFPIPGMIAGCVSIESLMYSTTECLFDHLCLKEIASYINYTSTQMDSFSVLNQSQATRNKTIETLANNLFVEDWIIKKSYDDYFNHCQPLFCQYTDQQGHSFVQVLIAIVSLFGGLRVILTLLIPPSIKLIRKKKQPRPTGIDENSSISGSQLE